MKSRILLAAATCLLGTALGCGNNGLNSESTSYQLSYNGCDTGEHSFDSVEKYCDGLRDEQLNHGCAIKSRKQLFNQNCSGKSWPEPAGL